MLEDLQELNTLQVRIEKDLRELRQELLVVKLYALGWVAFAIWTIQQVFSLSKDGDWAAFLCPLHLIMIILIYLDLKQKYRKAIEQSKRYK